MGETNGPASGQVLILLRDGRALQATPSVPYGMALLIRNDLRYWLVGSRTLAYVDAEGREQSLQADSVDDIAVIDPESLEFEA